MKKIIGSYVVGIIIAHSIIGYLKINIWVGIVALIPLILILILSHRTKAIKAFTLTTIFTFMVIGATAYLIRYNSVSSLHTSYIHSATSSSTAILSAPTPRLSVTVTDIPTIKPKTYMTTVEDANGARYITYLSRLQGQPIPQIGNHIHLSAYPHLQPSQPYHFFQGISATCYSYDWVVDCSDSISSIHQYQQIMSKIYHDANQLGESETLDSEDDMTENTNEMGDVEALAIIEAMTSGNKTGLSKDMKSRYAKAGVSHVLALSGYHLSIMYIVLNFVISMILMLLGKFWYIFGIRRNTVSHFIVLAVTWSFVALAGAPASLIRAAIMLSSMLVTHIFGWRTSMKDALWLSCILMLCYDPFFLMTPSFQLSFLSMIALLYSAPIMHLTRKRKKSKIKKQEIPGSETFRWIANNILSTLRASVVCSCITMPLVAYYFGMVPLVSVISNVVVSALASCLLVLAMVWWALYWIFGPQIVVGRWLINVTETMNDVVSWFASLDWGFFMWKPSIMAVVLAYGLIALIWKRKEAYGVMVKLLSPSHK